MSNNTESHEGVCEKQNMTTSKPSVSVDGFLIDEYKVVNRRTEAFMRYEIVIKTHGRGRLLVFETKSEEMMKKVRKSEKWGKGQVRITALIQRVKKEVISGTLHSFKMKITDIKAIIRAEKNYPLASALEKRFKIDGVFKSRWQQAAEAKKSLNDRFERITSEMEHKLLNEKDSCFVLGHYAPKRGLEYSETNRLVLKMKENDEQAIKEVAQKFKIAIDEQNLTRMLFVPVPPSQVNPEQKDRIEKMLSEIEGLKFKKCIRQIKSTIPNHRSGTNRISRSELKDIYVIDWNDMEDVKEIAIVDDVVTKGTHFKAISEKIKEKNPEVSIIGLFVARTMLWHEFD